MLRSSTDRTPLRVWGDQAGTSLAGGRVQPTGVRSEDTLGRTFLPMLLLPPLELPSLSPQVPQPEQTSVITRACSQCGGVMELKPHLGRGLNREGKASWRQQRIGKQAPAVGKCYGLRCK